ncbi:MAG: hypothetical protein DMF50_03880 [Acidobacteria bacterium]|nr:MAG: hypothetical protein DMF50_03880 [Acidobacteriota bacterium]
MTPALGPRGARTASVFFGFLVLAASAGAAPATDSPAPGPGALRVSVETIAVDRRGTWSVGTDDADLFSGSMGELQKSATLVGRQAQNPPREMVQLTARITPALKAGGACALRVDSETRRVVAGAKAGSRPPPVDRKSVAVLLKPDEERMVEVYASPVTEARLAFKLRCAPATGAPDGTSGSEPTFIDIVLSVARAEGDQDLTPLKTNDLRATLGRSASNLFSFNVPLEAGKGAAKRYRREKIEAQISPTLISGGRLQIEAGLQGEVATVSGSEATVSHPIVTRETLVLAPDEPHAFDLEVRSSGPEEGWSRVRYRIEITCRF